MPPSEASAPGSIGKNRPWSRRYSLSCLRVMPGSTTQSRSSACTASTRFMSRKSIETPPYGALIWPSSEVPVPNAITGTRCWAQMRTICCTSACRLREHDRVRRLVRDPRGGVGVLLAHRRRRDDAVAERRRQRGDRFRRRPRVARRAPRIGLNGQCPCSVQRRAPRYHAPADNGTWPAKRRPRQERFRDRPVPGSGPLRIWSASEAGVSEDRHWSQAGLTSVQT